MDTQTSEPQRIAIRVPMELARELRAEAERRQVTLTVVMLERLVRK